jgi:hypothetical protein
MNNDIFLEFFIYVVQRNYKTSYYIADNRMYEMI